MNGMARARRRDRRVYLGSHPVLLALLAAAQRLPVLRLGGTLLVNGETEYREALTRLPLDRLAAGTTGAIARELAADGRLLFDEDGATHRGTRRTAADDLGAAGVRRLRPVWQAVLDDRLPALARGETIDMVEVTRAIAGATVAKMSTVDACPLAIAQAAGDVASASVREHLSGPRFLATLLGAAGRSSGGARAGRTGASFGGAAGRSSGGARAGRTGASFGGAAGRSSGGARGARTEAEAATARLTALLGGGPDAGLATVLAVTAVSTTVAGLPRAVAWCADAGLWTDAADDTRREALVDELLRVVAAVPVVTRVSGEDGAIGGCPVRKGDKLLLVARHAVAAHRRDPDPARPAPPSTGQLVFGAGPHACPGARLARAQLDDTLRALAPYRPVVVKSTVDRKAALPGWSSLLIRGVDPSRTPADPRGLASSWGQR